MAYSIAIVIGLVLTITLIALNESIGLLRSDRFSSPLTRWLAYLWFGAFATFVSVMVATSSSRHAPVDLKQMPFWTLFIMHIILLIFLAVWWLLSGRMPLSDFFNLRSADPFRSSMTGLAVGVGGWAMTLALAMAAGAILMAFKLVPQDLKPSPMIPWMAALPLWQKAMIVFSAMTVEELFFRAWLQKRVGLLISTALFALAHVGYGQPLMLIGITIVSLIIGYTFYRTKSLWPCMIAHGVFDAIQLFVIVPVAVKLGGM